MVTTKAGAVLAASLIALSSLSGCVETFGAGPNSLSREGDVLLVAVCVSIDAREIYGSFENDEDEYPFLDLKGAGKIEAESILRPGVLDGFDGSFDSIDATGVTALNLKFEGVGKGASWASTFGANGPISIPNDGWLQTNGQVTEKPCP